MPAVWRLEGLFEQIMECMETRRLSHLEISHLLDWGDRLIDSGPPPTTGRGAGADEFFDRVPGTRLVVGFFVDLDTRLVSVTEIVAF